MSGAGSEITWPRVIRGRAITAEDARDVQQLVAEQRGASRWVLARALCERWQWRTAAGKPKSRSALGVLRELARQGWIELPPASACALHLRKSTERVAAENDSGASGVAGALWQYRPLRWELVATAGQRRA